MLISFIKEHSYPAVFSKIAGCTATATATFSFLKSSYKPPDILQSFFDD